MPTTHRTLDGNWQLCADPETCELKFHFPDMTPSQMALIPERALWRLLEALDPPMFPQPGGSGGGTWGTPEVEVHREYDLPAYISDDGNFQEWYSHGQRDRRGGKPAHIDSHGLTAWFQAGKLHREDGPAIINKMSRDTQLYVRLPGADKDVLTPIHIGRQTKQYWRNGIRVAEPE